jgi:hypothetical protein
LLKYALVFRKPGRFLAAETRRAAQARRKTGPGDEEMDSE